MSNITQADEKLVEKLATEALDDAIIQVHRIKKICEISKEIPLDQLRISATTAQVMLGDEEHSFSEADWKRFNAFREFRAKLEAIRG